MRKVYLMFGVLLAAFYCGNLVHGVPTSDKTSDVPDGTTSGGAGGLLPAYDSGVKTEASIGASDSSAVGFLAGVGGIMSYGTDSATAKDSGRKEFKTSDLGKEYKAVWKVYLTGEGTAEAHTLNAPGNTPYGSYSSDASSTLRFNIKVNGESKKEDQKEANAEIKNNKSGNLADTALVSLGTIEDPHPITDDDGGTSSKLAVSYDVEHGIALSAQRDGVGVGGKAKGHIFGHVEAWAINVDGDHIEFSLMKTSNNNDDAVWALE